MAAVPSAADPADAAGAAGRRSAARAFPQVAKGAAEAEVRPGPGARVAVQPAASVRSVDPAVGPADAVRSADRPAACRRPDSEAGPPGAGRRPGAAVTTPARRTALPAPRASMARASVAEPSGAQAAAAEPSAARASAAAPWAARGSAAQSWAAESSAGGAVAAPPPVAVRRRAAEPGRSAGRRPAGRAGLRRAPAVADRCPEPDSARDGWFRRAGAANRSGSRSPVGRDAVHRAPRSPTSRLVAPERHRDRPTARAGHRWTGARVR